MIHTDDQLPPERKIIKARVKLIMRDPFFGSFAIKLKLKTLTRLQAERLKTRLMATDGRFLYYYPEGVKNEPFENLVGVVTHEAAHVALKHHLRRGDRNFRIWNRAADITLNNILVEAGYKLPEFSLSRPDLKDMAAERVYKILIEENRQKRQALKERLEALQQQIDESDQQPDDFMLPEGGDELGGEDNESKDQDDEQSDSDQEQIENEDFQQDENWDTNPDDTDPDDTDDHEIPREMEHAQDGSNELEDDTQPDAEGSFQINPDHLEDENQLEQLPEVSNLDETVQDGVVLDAPDNIRNEDGERELDLSIENAYINAKNAGMMPGNIERLIESSREHKIDYRDLLRDWLDQNVFKNDYSWRQPNRRYLHYDMILPGPVDEEDWPNVAFFCDTSGSVSEPELKAYSREISGVLSEFPCDFDVVYGDTKVRHVQHFSCEDLPIKLEIHGGGGTKFMPGFDHIRENLPDVDAILFFTDMGAWDWDKVNKYDPGVPVLWMNTNRYADDFQVPFGTVIPLEVDDDDNDDF